MATMQQVERRIRKVEGFDVRVLHLRDGRDVRSDMRNVPMYSYERAAKATMTVRGWRDGRFAREFPGFDVEVLDPDGSVVNGRTMLSTLRARYQAAQ